MGIPLMMGRDFSQNDRTESPGVAIVNRTLARVVWPTGDPVGRRLQLLMPAGDTWVTVIGVASDVRESLDPRYPLELEPRPTIYRPVSQEPITGMTVIVRTAPDPMTLAEPVRREITVVDSTVPVTAMQTVRQGLSESMHTPRFNAILLTGFAALALLLAAVGVYGVVAYSVNQRRQEIGIRMALGAAPTRILRTIISEGFTLGIIGGLLGVVGGFGAVRLIAHYLYGVQPADPLTFIVVVAMLMSVAGPASYVPARRAAAVNPLTVLRSE